MHSQHNGDVTDEHASFTYSFTTVCFGADTVTTGLIGMHARLLTIMTKLKSSSLSIMLYVNLRSPGPAPNNG